MSNELIGLLECYDILKEELEDRNLNESIK